MADAGLDREGNLRAGVFVGISLDLNSTNFSFRWSLAERAEQWARELGRPMSADELASWADQLRDDASPPLTANRTMGALGNIVASRITPPGLARPTSPVNWICGSATTGNGMNIAASR